MADEDVDEEDGEEDTVYIKKTLTTDPRFAGRVNVIMGFSKPIAGSSSDPAIRANPARLVSRHDIPIPDNVVLCNGCNNNIHPDPGWGYMVYFGKRELEQDRPYDFYCESCTKENWPKAEVVP